MKINAGGPTRREFADAEKFLNQLVAKNLNQKRFSLVELLDTFKEAFPLHYNDPAINPLEALNGMLVLLEDREKITTPKSSKLWDFTQRPSLPKWILVTSEAEEKDYWWKTYPWRPELAFATNLPYINPKMQNNLLSLNEFFIQLDKEKGNVPEIPIKERSLLLFGDEKRLDNLLSTQMFKQGNLSLSMLKCYHTWEPFPYKQYPTRNMHSAIIIENKDTFHSFCRACGTFGKDSPYNYVIYGQGFNILSSIMGIDEFDPKITMVEYFGDLDPVGLQIPLSAKNKLHESNYSQKIIPATDFYRKMYELHSQVQCKVLMEKNAAKWNDELLNFLPSEEMKSRARILFEKKERIPQEIVNYNEILQILKKKLK